MKQLFTRRFFVTAGLSASIGHVALANAPQTSLRPHMRGGRGATAVAAPAAHTATSPQALIKSAQLGGAVTFAVADLRSGKLLETNDAEKGMPPASTAKAVTALYALDALGPKHRFATRLVTNGSIAGGVISRDLYLVGGGDPTLDTNGLASMAAQLKSLGIREVRGNFYYVETALPQVHDIDPDQPEHVGYNPSVSGLNLNYNRVHFEWKRAGSGYSVSMDARSDKYRPAVYIARMQVAARSLPVYTYRNSDGFDNWTVASGALGKGGSRWLPVRKPGLYAADVFQTLARAHGIVLKSPQASRTVPAARALVTHTSPQLTNILRGMLKYSTNLTAEAVGLAATIKRGKRPSNLAASASEMSRWANANLGMGGAKFADHSGLSEDSRVSAAGMVNAMISARRRMDFSVLLKPIAMRDEQRKVIKNHPIDVRAKTGTLNFVSALSGYMTAPDGSQMAFAALCADTVRRRSIKRGDMEAPQGGRQWNRRAKALQQKLIERWGAVYG